MKTYWIKPYKCGQFLVCESPDDVADFLEQMDVISLDEYDNVVDLIKRNTYTTSKTRIGINTLEGNEVYEIEVRDLTYEEYMELGEFEGW